MPMSLHVGLGGAERHGCVTLCTDKQILGICEQERITRVRAAGFNATGLPDEVLDELLRRAGKQRHDVTTYTLVEPETADNPFTELFQLDQNRLRLAPEWQATVERRLRGVGPQQRAPIAAALQSRVGDLLLEFLAEVRRHVPETRRLCVSGSLFH